MLTDVHKDNLFMFGSIIHSGIQAVEVDTDVNNHDIKYRVYVSSKLLSDYNSFHKKVSKGSIWSLFWAKRLIKKHTFLDWETAINNFVHTYCGAKWTVSVKILPIKEYIDESED